MERISERVQEQKEKPKQMDYLKKIPEAGSTCGI